MSLFSPEEPHCSELVNELKFHKITLQSPLKASLKSLYPKKILFASKVPLD